MNYLRNRFGRRSSSVNAADVMNRRSSQNRENVLRDLRLKRSPAVSNFEIQNNNVGNDVENPTQVRRRRRPLLPSHHHPVPSESTTTTARLKTNRNYEWSDTTCAKYKTNANYGKCLMKYIE